MTDEQIREASVPDASGADASASAVSERQTWYFTFGSGQPNANRFYVVEDATYEDARERMVSIFGRVWSFQYDESEWVRDGVSQAEQYGLERIR